MSLERSFSSIGQIIDTDIESLEPLLNELSLGELNSIENLLKLEYTRAEMVKNGILEMEQSVTTNFLTDLYIILQRIEDRCTLIEILKANKTSQPLNFKA